MPRRVFLAVLLAFSLHGILVVIAHYRLSYDAYTHMFFSDHYHNHWWSLWDPRWFGGFTVVSYPPLVHQLIALTSFLTGVDRGYALISLAVLTAFPLGVYAFSRVFVGRSAAGYAALAAAVLPSIYLAAHTFGQLPTLTGALFALFSAAALADFLRTGRPLNAALAVMLVACVMGAHHATLLFLPALFISVGLHQYLHEPKNWLVQVLRLGIFGFAAIGAGFVVIWPFWMWVQVQGLQTPIDHATRHNLFLDMKAALLFFWSAYGPLILVIPYALIKGLRRRFIGLNLAFLFMFILGLGGSTPLPAWLFGPRWEWLTYDRFTFWASLLLLPFLGSLMSFTHHKLRPRLSKAILATPAWLKLNPGTLKLVLDHADMVILLSLFASFSLLVSFYPVLIPTQPRPIEMKPIVDFLSQNDRSQWRYLTFGFGDQFAYLNRLTKATTIDGSYFTARLIPELRDSGIGSIDAEFWNPLGLPALDPLLRVVSKYGVRWAFVADEKYSPILKKNGWKELYILSNGIVVWENPVAILPSGPTPPTDDPLKSFSWGTLPLLALVMTAALTGLRLSPVHAQNFLFKFHAFIIGLLPVGLVFWYFRPLTAQEIPRIYFIYDNTLVFLVDVMALVGVLAWAAAKWVGPVQPAEMPVSIRRGIQSIQLWLFLLVILATISILWSQDQLVSAGICLHLWLGYGLFLSLQDRPTALGTAVLGFCAALGLQIMIGFAEFIRQTTQFLQPLGMNWPGALTPMVRGASVVQIANGLRWLRVYGTLPHPNILGIFILAFLIGPAFLFLTSRARAWALFLFSTGLILLVLTFSRGAWIGLLAGALIMVTKLRSLNTKRLGLLSLCGVVGLLAVIFPLRGLIVTRIQSPASIPTEEFSILARTWLANQALGVIKQHPLTGLGIGSFVLDLARRAGIGYIIEPVHNLPLLVASELGMGSTLFLCGLGAAVLAQIWQTRRPAAILLSASLIGLGSGSLFDHSLWTLAPGRILAWLILGLWAGQVKSRFVIEEAKN